MTKRSRAWQWADAHGELGAGRSEPATSPAVKQIGATPGEGTGRGEREKASSKRTARELAVHSESESPALGDTERADVTFMVDGQQIVAHRCVLEARSSYFRNLFEASDNNAHVLAYVSAGSFRVLLRFLYTRDLPQDEDCGEGLSPGEMARVAGQFCEDELHDHCLKLWQQGMRPDNAIERLVVAEESGSDALRAAALAFFASNSFAVQKEASKTFVLLHRAPDLAIELLRVFASGRGEQDGPSCASGEGKGKQEESGIGARGA